MNVGFSPRQGTIRDTRDGGIRRRHSAVSLLVTMIQITDDVAIDEAELDIKFVRSGGPGGQHVNKVATAVQLRFDASASPALSDDIRKRLAKLAGNRISDDGVITIDASRFRSQKRNREDAVERLIDLIRRATEKPKKRRRTKPSASAVAKRLDEKRRRSAIKDARQPIREPD